MQTAQTASADRRVEAALHVLVWTALYALPVALALRPLVDPDIWWHLRAGQWIVEHGTLPATDPFSQYGVDSGKPWVAYSWLFEVLVYELHRTLGFPGLFLFRAVMTLLVVLALHRLAAKRASNFAAAALLTGVAVLGLLPMLTERPWLFTLLFGALTLDVVLDLREGRTGPMTWLLPPLYALWANLHVQFVYGLFLLGLAVAAAVLDGWLGLGRGAKGAARAWSRPWWLLAGLTAACALATLANPYHVRLYEAVFDHATQKKALVYVAEMRALEFRDPWDWCLPVAVAAAAFALGRRQRLSSFDVLLLAASSWFAFRARRDIWFPVLAALAIVSTTHPAAAAARPFLPSRRQGLAVALLALPLWAAYWSFCHTGSGFRATLEANYPVGAVEHVKRQRYDGPLFNHYNWGGFLMWEMPDRLVSMDGRANLHGDDRLDASFRTWAALPEWEDNPDLRRAGLVIAGTQEPLTSLLAKDPRFRRVYQDAVATVFVARKS
jgi:hypothetical protein